MKVLVLGSGAKDHAIAWYFSRSHLIEALYVAPGNVGTASIATNIPIDPDSYDQVLKACKTYGIDYVFIGTEGPLFTGMAEKLASAGLKVFGASGDSLKLEGDRAFARDFTARHNIPTPQHRIFKDIDELSGFLKEHKSERFVIKSKGVAPSRIMIDSGDYDALMEFASPLIEDNGILVEQHITGLPVTVTALVDNKSYLLLPFSSDYMKSEHKTGAPTGGMGAVCPVPLDYEQKQLLEDRIIRPTIDGMKEEGLGYKGVLTFSTILTSDGPVLVDYHLRFNDPTTQAMIPLLKTDFIKILTAMESDNLDTVTLKLSNDSTVAFVVASEGYPTDPKTGIEVATPAAFALHNAFPEKGIIFCGGVEQKDGKVIITGGRCVTLVGKADNIVNANQQAYSILPALNIPGGWWREDIGNKFFEN